MEQPNDNPQASSLPATSRTSSSQHSEANGSAHPSLFSRFAPVRARPRADGSPSPRSTPPERAEAAASPTMKNPPTKGTQLRFQGGTEDSGLEAQPKFKLRSAASQPDLRLGEDEFAEGDTEEDSYFPQQSPSERRDPMPSVGTATPPGRRSVQFAHGTQEPEPTSFSASRPQSIREEENEDEIQDFRERNPSIVSKLKAWAGSSGGPHSHVRTNSAFSVGGASTTERTTSNHTQVMSDPGQPITYDSVVDEGTEADADDSGVEDNNGNTTRRTRKRKSKKPKEGDPQNAPSTPKSPSRPHFFSSGSNSQGLSESFRPRFMHRRATETDMVRDQGVSEDEGRERMKRESPWRRGSAWVQNARGTSYSASRQQDGQPTSETRAGKRPSNLRRLTVFGGTSEGADQPPRSPWRTHRGDRQTSLSAQKWNRMKAAIKMMAQRKRAAEKNPDMVKSAQLIAELSAGSPAAILVASMFQRDEHGSQRIPVLLEQLKINVADSKQEQKHGDRNLTFYIQLEYGNGLTRMKWTIERNLRDFANLHVKYKLARGRERLTGREDSRKQLPRFPRSALPYLRDYRGLVDDDDDEDDEPSRDAEGSGNATERPGKRRLRRSSTGFSGRRSSAAPSDAEGIEAGAAGAAGVAGAVGSAGVRKEPYAERQRKKLELYLQSLTHYLMFRPESNRLCKFLELSALGVRLAAENSYHGKEGLLVIQSAKSMDFRRTLKPSVVKKRHSPKWFLVRHSYLVCVDSPEAMNIYDVFLLDPDFELEKQPRLLPKKPREMARAAKSNTTPQHHIIRMRNSEGKLKLIARNERQLQQFENSIRQMAEGSPWSKPNRFESYAPVRTNCFAQWIVDGRDHMWMVSRAIDQAKDVIYIHDWWLSPELYLRRPAAISQKWRLDRLLQRKAQEGVKVFVIMYRNIESAIPIDSEYSKFCLLDLHPNVFVQRSPNQFKQNQFFWAHHEKLCIVDHILAFVGGVDLCFGRWDTPQHSVVDDKQTGFELNDMPKDADHCQLWPGKDYSNPRVQDFYALDKPYEEMYDRARVPRMPWHDISMQVIGQPARDLCRHFVQRWNYVLRQRKPTRPTPFLLPPPDFAPAELEALGLDGTCEVQMLRSCTTWSIGTPDKTEHSIMNAYIKAIEQSDHFIYIENQFFVSSCEVEGVRIHNQIGDALVERIIRAAKNGEEWRAVIVIPLMPGFQNTVDNQDGTSVRLIMQCQYRSICRGESSIFGRLRNEGIEPEDFIQYYSLRSWGKIGPKKQLVTEQLYIHAKCMVADDRIAIIGSANINERSMLGSRDSECAAIVRDSDMLWSHMAGQPYLVGRFPHTLRMRLMREHLGLDVDHIHDQEHLEEVEQSQWDKDMDQFHREVSEGSGSPASLGDSEQQRRHSAQEKVRTRAENLASFNHDVDWEQPANPNTTNFAKKRTKDARVTGTDKHRKDLAGLGPDNMKAKEDQGVSGARDTAMVGTADGNKELLVSPAALESKGPLSQEQSSPDSLTKPIRDNSPAGNEAFPPFPEPRRMTTAEAGLPLLSQLPELPQVDDADIGGPPVLANSSDAAAQVTHPLVADMRRPMMVDKDCMRDPLNDSFFTDIWHTIAENNTRLYRTVFRCMPDNEVKNWKEYKEYQAYAMRFTQMQGFGKDSSMGKTNPDHVPKSGPPGSGQPHLGPKISSLGPIGEKSAEAEKTAEDNFEVLKDKLSNVLPLNSNSKPAEPNADDKLASWAEEANKAQLERQGLLSPINTDVSLDEKAELRSPTLNSPEKPDSAGKTSLEGGEKLHKQATFADSSATNSSTQRRRRRATTRSSRKEFHASDDLLSMQDAEELLNLVQGHLVVWPYEW